jgi:hypothetical protein
LINTPAGILEIAQNAYDNGFLCKCPSYESRFDGDETPINHKTDCEGKEIFRKIISGESFYAECKNPGHHAIVKIDL